MITRVTANHVYLEGQPLTNYSREHCNIVLVILTHVDIFAVLRFVKQLGLFKAVLS